tara:strand:+ start:94 stop:285 length:192 start_codon:yes stop_codon:yes gene_type:complete
MAYFYLCVATLEQRLIVFNAWLLKPVIHMSAMVMPPATYLGIAACILLALASFGARPSSQKTL